MNLLELVEQIKKEGMLLKPPRKRSKRRREKEASAPRAKVRKSTAGVLRRHERGIWGRWKMLVRSYRLRAKKRNIPFEEFFQMKIEDWIELWREAGDVVLANGTKVKAFSLRGKYKESCKMWRIDEDKPWKLENVVVLYKGQVLANGRAISKRMYG